MLCSQIIIILLCAFPYITSCISSATGSIFSRDSSVGIATDYGLDDQGGREFESR
jgi:hypothetical protein